MNNNNIKKEKSKFKIYPGVIVDVVKNGNNVDLRFSPTKGRPNIKKINKEEYINLNTGEIHKFEKKEKKENDNLKKTFRQLRQLINCNFSDGKKNKLFLTLTYEENMRDNKRLYKDADKFIKRLKYAYKEIDFSYIIVAEPQDRGAWHLHIMLKALNKHNLYICNKELEKLWGHGITEAKRLKDVDGVGNYYTAYFTNLSKDKKGSRLPMYPIGFKIYRTSRNIKKPVVEKIQYGELKEQYGKPTYSNAYNILKDDKIVNIVVVEQYKISKTNINEKERVNYSLSQP